MQTGTHNRNCNYSSKHIATQHIYQEMFVVTDTGEPGDQEQKEGQENQEEAESRSRIIGTHGSHIELQRRAVHPPDNQPIAHITKVSN